MKVIFFTSWKNRSDNDSITALKYSIKNLEIVACVLDGDMVIGDFTKICADYSIPVYTRDNILDSISNGMIQKPDIGIAYHYHSKIKKEVLLFPENGIINFHPAPLPEHKGVSACTYAILHNYAQWGVTAHYMDEDFDTGSIIKVRKFDIEKYDCSSIALQRINYKHLLSLFTEVVDMLALGTIPAGTPQEDGGHYYSRKNLENDKAISLTDNKNTIDHKIRAMWFPPYHGANITIDGEVYTLVNKKILNELGDIYSIVMQEHKELFGGLE